MIGDVGLVLGMLKVYVLGKKKGKERGGHKGMMRGGGHRAAELGLVLTCEGPFFSVFERCTEDLFDGDIPQALPNRCRKGKHFGVCIAATAKCELLWKERGDSPIHGWLSRSLRYLLGKDDDERCCTCEARWCGCVRRDGGSKREIGVGEPWVQREIAKLR